MIAAQMEKAPTQKERAKLVGTPQASITNWAALQRSRKFVHGKGISRWLMEQVLGVGQEQCDSLYWLGNDSVMDHYPRYGP